MSWIDQANGIKSEKGLTNRTRVQSTMSHVRKRCLASNKLKQSYDWKRKEKHQKLFFCEKNGPSPLADAFAQWPLSYLLGKGRGHTFELWIPLLYVKHLKMLLRPRPCKKKMRVIREIITQVTYCNMGWHPSSSVNSCWWKLLLWFFVFRRPTFVVRDYLFHNRHWAILYRFGI